MPSSDGQITARQLCSGVVSERVIADGAVTETKINDGAVSVTKLASSLTVPQVVDVLPGTASEGDLAYLTTNDKLYRYDGSAWILEVDGADIADATITADKMVANTLTAGTIAAGAIGTDELAANAVTAEKISAASISTRELAGVADLMFYDPSFELQISPLNDAEGIYTNSALTLDYIQRDGSGGNVRTGDWALRLSQFVFGSTTGQHYISVNGQYATANGYGIPVTPGEELYGVAYLGKRGTLTTSCVRVGWSFYEHDGTLVSGTYSSYYNPPTVSTDAVAWREAEHTATVPATAAYAFFLVHVNADLIVSGDNFAVHVDDMVLRRRVTLRLVGDLESTNFSTGTAGWQLTEAGDIELNNATVRGTLRTASGTGQRVEIGTSSVSQMRWYNSSNANVGLIYDTTTHFVVDAGQGNLYLNAASTIDFQPGGGTLVGRFVASTVSSIYQLRMDSGSESYPSYGFISDTDTGFFLSSAGVVGFSSGGSERMVFAANALRGQQTTGTFYMPHSAAGSASAPTYSFYGDIDTGMYRSATDQIGFATAGTARYIMGAGAFAPFANNTYDLGSSSLTWSTVFRQAESTGSDERIKQDIVDLDGAADLIARLRPVEFRLRNNPDRRWWGFIAQEVESVVDDDTAIVHPPNPDDPDSRYGLNYEQLTAPLVAAVQDLQRRIASLEEVTA